MSADREALLPCPFCGREARKNKTSIDSDTQLELQCAGCGVQFVYWLPWTADATDEAEAWAKLFKAWGARKLPEADEIIARAMARAKTGSEASWPVHLPFAREVIAKAAEGQP